MSGERAWVETVRADIAEALARQDMAVETGRRLPYAMHVLAYENQEGEPALAKPARTETHGYQTDLLIAERTSEAAQWVPRVVVEFKLGSVTTHDALTYSAKAATHKNVHPYLRYGIVIGNHKGAVPRRLIRHGHHFDFMLTLSSERLSTADRRRLVELLEEEVRASQRIEALLRERSDITLLHRKLAISKSMACFHSAPSNAQPPLAPEIPIDGATRRHRARDMLAEFLIERGPPRHQLKSKPIVNHSEATRRQRDAMAIGTSDVFALGGGAMCKAGFGRELGDRVVQLAPAQGVQEIAGEDDPLSLAAGQAFLDEMIRAPIHRIAHLGRSLLQTLVCDKRVLAVEEEHVKLFSFQAPHRGRAVIQKRLPRGQRRPVDHLRQCQAQRRGLDDFDGRNRILREVEFFQPLHRCGDDIGKASEFVDEGFCQRFCIRARNRHEQQQFQELLIGQRLRTARKETFAQPFAMADIVRKLCNSGFSQLRSTSA